MHDIRYNAVDDEILVPNPFSNAILAFRGGADGQEAPIRIIQGPNTQLNGPDRLDIDVVNREIFVPGRGDVLVFPLDGNGDVRPKRVVRGPDTQIDGSSIAVDPLPLEAPAAHDLIPPLFGSVDAESGAQECQRLVHDEIGRQEVATLLEPLIPTLAGSPMQRIVGVSQHHPARRVDEEAPHLRRPE